MYANVKENLRADPRFVNCIPIHCSRIADSARIPVALSVFTPPDPVIPNDTCHAYLIVELTGGAALVKYDPSFAPAGFSTEMLASDLSAIVPNTSQCPAPLPDRGLTARVATQAGRGPSKSRPAVPQVQP
ncbi:MAG: hypothetical protein L0Y43_03290 [Methylococcaceae bacterium]|nr:hypothetical protein [Methylococcaceae bacterium]